MLKSPNTAKIFKTVLLPFSLINLGKVEIENVSVSHVSHNMGDLQQPMQKQPYKKANFCVTFFAAFWNLRRILNILKQKG